MRRTSLAFAVPLLVTSLLLAAGAAADPRHGKGEEKIRVHLKGLEEVPAVSTAATGELRLTINDAAGTIAYELTYENLQGTVAQAHIHVGQKSVIGGIALWLCQTAGTQAPRHRRRAAGPRSGSCTASRHSSATSSGSSSHA